MLHRPVPAQAASRIVIRAAEIVDCGTCSACCRAEFVALVKGDDPKDYPEAVKFPEATLAEILPSAIGYIIPHGPDGACVYLKDDKCSIYEKRPKMCRVFSCVKFVESILATTTRAQRRSDRQFIVTEVWKAGMKRRRRGAARPGEV